MLLVDIRQLQSPQRWLWMAVVCNAYFLETSIHKSHRYISHYHKIFEEKNKSQLIVRKIR